MQTNYDNRGAWAARVRPHGFAHGTAATRSRVAAAAAWTTTEAVQIGKSI